MTPVEYLLPHKQKGSWDLACALGDLLDKSQRVLPDVDQAPQSLHRFLGRRGGVRELSETKWGQQCVYKAIPNWKMLLGE